MQISLANIQKKAINAALKSEWDLAIDLNKQILDIIPDNLEAKVRLGRAYLQTSKFKEATKVFKEVLQKDPINSVALKNLEIAKQQKTDDKEIDTNSLLKEPGTTTEVLVNITNKKYKSKDFTPGQPLELKINSKIVKVSKVNGKTEEIGIIEEKSIVEKLNHVKNSDGSVNASFIKEKEDKMCILLKASLPIFKSEKQDIRPYMKKGSIDDPDMENEEEEEVITEE